MLADDIAYKNKIHAFSREALEEECLSRKKDSADKSLRLEEIEKALTLMSRDYKALEKELEETRAKCRQYESIFEHMGNNDALYLRELFGSNVENLGVLMKGHAAKGDPLDEDAGREDKKQEEAHARDDTEKSREDTDSSTGGNTSESRKRIRHMGQDGGKKPSSRRKGDLARKLAGLPRKVEYRFDPETYDRDHGKNGWAISNWHHHLVVEERKVTYYVRDIMTPVLSVNNRETKVTIPYNRPVFPKSILGHSLMAEILFCKFFLHMPFYRQEENMEQACGFSISRQTMARQAVRISKCLHAAYDFMCRVQADCPYQNIDETYLRVLKEEGSHSGKKYYVWIFSTGELSGTTTPVTVYKYGPSRSADNLREQLGIRDYLRVITSDAYNAYPAVEKESNGKISVSICMMHARRRWVYALEVLHPEKYTDEQLAELPEVKALLLLQKVFELDTPLKTLSAGERKAARQKDVKPAMKAYLDYVHSLDPESPGLGEKAKDAISYTLNQESGLVKFLDDGHIPIDNGKAERMAKYVAMGRRNWLFADTPDGAEAICIYETFVQTARANNANVRFYLQYLIDRIPEIPEDKEEREKFLPELMPWSEKYREYEKKGIKEELELSLSSAEPERPRTPRKRKAAQAA